MLAAQKKQNISIFGEERSNHRILKYLTIMDKSVQLPEKKNKDALTLFFEIDDVFAHTFLCDENFGYMANPGSGGKDPEYEFLLEE